MSAVSVHQLSRLIVADNRGLSVNFAHLGLGDADVPSILSALEAAAPPAGSAAAARGPATTALTLVFEMNFFGDAAIRDFLLRFRAWSAPGSPFSHLWVHRLRLHMNRLSDVSCDALASYLCEIPLSFLPGELHLSHNRISSAGALALVGAAARRYPRIPKNDGPPIPLWLRLEHNVIDASFVRRRAAGLGAKWCPGESAGGRGGRGAGRGGRGGRGGGALRCGASLCLTNNALAKRTRGASRGGRGGGRGGKAGGAALPTLYAHVHLCFLDEQRPLSTRTGSALAGLVRGTTAAVARAAAAAPAPAAVIAALSAPINIELDEDEDLGDGEAATEVVDAEGELGDDSDEGAFGEPDSVDDGASAQGAASSRAASPTVDDTAEATVQASAVAGAALDSATVARPPPSTSIVPLFVVLDTSAVVRMVERGTSTNGAAIAPFSFSNFGVSNLRGGVVWVLLDTVLQQLDDSKSASAYLGRIVNAFMRLYPQLESVGALVRLAAEDVEDAVRAGANVVSQPGCRKSDGKFDSDGVIIDASLLVLRSLVSATAPVGADAPEHAKLILLTADVAMRNRAMGVGLPSALWEDVNRNFALSVTLTTATLLDALPLPARSMLQASGGGALARGGDGGGEGASSDGAGNLGVLGGRSATLELRAAVGVVTELASAARALIVAHGCARAGGECDACTSAARAVEAADASVRGWQQVVSAKMAASSLHAAVFSSRAADVDSLARGFAAARI